MKLQDGSRHDALVDTGYRIGNAEGMRRGSEVEVYSIIGMVLGSVLFGAIHLAAWNFRFPTQTDRILWLVAAVASTVIFPAYFVLDIALLWCTEHILSMAAKLSDSFTDYASMFTTDLYILARIILIVEMFRCLFYLPPDAYTTTWASNFPHIG